MMSIRWDIRHMGPRQASLAELRDEWDGGVNTTSSVNLTPYGSPRRQSVLRV
jgi:hypothetical protein